MSGLQKVVINSNQTNQKIGEVLFIENDPIWGPQYLISVDNPEWHTENFWMRDYEIKIKGK